MTARRRMPSTAVWACYPLNKNGILSLLIWVLPQQTWRGSCQQKGHFLPQLCLAITPSPVFVSSQPCSLAKWNLMSQDLFWFSFFWPKGFFLEGGLRDLIWTQTNSDGACLNSQRETKILYSVKMNKWKRTETGENSAVQKRMSIRVIVFLWSRVSMGNTV